MLIIRERPIVKAKTCEILNKFKIYIMNQNDNAN